MSLIDDVVHKKLPTGGKVQANVGASSVQKKLKAATRVGALKNLSDNQDVINKIANKRQQAIRTGKYTRQQTITDFKEAVRGGNLTKDDKKDLKAILKHWSKGEVSKTAEVKEPSEASKRAASKRAELKAGPLKELPEFLQNRGSVSISGNQPYDPNPGSGGGINAGLGGETSNKPSTDSFTPPKLY